VLSPMLRLPKRSLMSRKKSLLRNSSSDDVMLRVVTCKRSTKPDRRPLTRTSKGLREPGFRGVLSHRSVHNEGWDEENHDSGARFWKEAVSYVSCRLGFASEFI
jgi:hypothetical protein